MQLSVTPITNQQTTKETTQTGKQTQRNKLHGAESLLGRRSLSFMEPLCSLPCSQEISTGAYSKPEKLSIPPYTVLLITILIM
jgi:hypothetical protein